MAQPPEPATNRRSVGLVVLDLLLTLTILPILAAVWFGALGAWQVYHPKRRPQKKTPESMGLQAEHVTVPGHLAGDPPLAGWFIPSPTGKDTVVLAHGISRDKTNVLPQAAMLHAAGYHVFAFDLRNHGESGNDGLLRDQADRYIADFRRVIAYLRQRSEELNVGQLAVFAFSFSTWPGLQMARLESDSIRAVICDSGPGMDGDAAMKRLLDIRRTSLPVPFRGPILYRVLTSTMSTVAHQILSPSPFPPEIADHSVRLLFIGGESDPIIPQHLVHELAEQYPWSTFWAAPHAPHMHAFQVSPQEYTSRVTDVLGKAFAGGAVDGATGKPSEL